MLATPTTPAEAPRLPAGIDPAYYALTLLRQRKLEDCVRVATHHLHLQTTTGSPASSATDAAGMDESMWYIQTKAMVLQSWYDDAEIEDDGVDDVLMEGEQAVTSTAHRPNTSLRTARRGTGTGTGVVPGSRAGRLGSAAGGRPVSSRYGFARPGTTQNRPGSVRGNGAGGTAMRPVTGRFVRLGTASLQAVPGGPHINTQRLNVEKYAWTKPMVAKLLCDYLLYVEHKPKMALELCTAALKPAKTGSPIPGLPPMLPMGGGGGSSSLPPPAPAYGSALPPYQQQQQVGILSVDDWWWKARLAKANYQLGLLREAEKNLKAALFEAPVNAVVGRGVAGGAKSSVGPGQRFVNYNTSTIMELGKVYLKMDQPLTALELYESALESNPIDHHIVICSARLRDELHEADTAFDLYNTALHLDSSNIESIACIGAHLFYGKNQPELALRYYRRLVQMGVNTAEVWNNVGLCAFYTYQMELSLSCFSRALQLCQEDSQRADVWYNVGHVGIGTGNIRFAERAFRLAVGADATHAEALNNLAVLAYEKQREKKGRRLFDTAVMAAPELPEALYNTALLAFEDGNLEVAHRMVMRVLDNYPDHPESVALQAKLRERFQAL